MSRVDLFLSSRVARSRCSDQQRSRSVDQFPSAGLVGRVILSSLADRNDEFVSGDLNLRPHEGLLMELSDESQLPAAPTSGMPT
jgi:hypothetical protein